MVQTNKLVIDIETIGEDFDALDHATQENLTRWIKKDSDNEDEYKLALQDLKNGLGFSPLTGEIVAIGVLDYHKNEGAVYYQAPGQKNEELKEDGITFKQMTEKECSESFGSSPNVIRCSSPSMAAHSTCHFIMARSAIKGIRPTKDLMRGRYLYQNNPDALHIDLARTAFVLRRDAAKGESAPLESRVRHSKPEIRRRDWG